MPPQLKKSNNRAKLEKSTYEQIVSHPEKDLELIGLEAPEELQIKTVTQRATQHNPEKPKPTCHYCKRPGHYRNRCRQLKREKCQSQNNTNSAGNNNNNNGDQTNCNSNNETPNNSNAINTNDQKDRKPTHVYPPCETCGKTVKLTIL